MTRLTRRQLLALLGCAGASVVTRSVTAGSASHDALPTLKGPVTRPRRKKIVGVFNTVGTLNTPGVTDGTDLPNFSAGGPIQALSNRNLLAVCDGMAQSSTQNVACVGSAGTGDPDWNNYDWPTLTTWGAMDAQMNNMLTATERVLNVYMAPFWLLGDPQGLLAAPTSSTSDYFWGNPVAFSVADSQVANFASFVHYLALRYTGRVPSPLQSVYAAHPITHMSIWSEMQGYYDPTVVVGGYYRFDRYATMFNAVWAALKSDPLTAPVQLGAPYCVAISTGLPVGQTPDISGPWGAVDSRVTAGTKALAGLQPLTLGAHPVAALTGCDFLVVDLSDHPPGLTMALSLQRFGDIVSWYRRVVAPAFGDCPIMVHEVYWDDGPAGLPAVLDACFDAGADSVYLFHQRPDTPGLCCLLVDGAGQPTDAYPYLASYQYD